MNKTKQNIKTKKIVQIEFDNQSKHNVILKSQGQFLYYSMGFKFFLVDKDVDI